MKTAASIIAAFAGIVAAQSLGDVPSCASQCGQDMIANDGTIEIENCDANDIGCLCQDPKFIQGIRDCVQATCNDQDAQSAVEAGLRLCRNAGVEITTPPGASATDGDASGSNTASASATTSGGNGGNGGGAGGIVSTITSDGETMVTTISMSSGDMGGSVSSALGSASSAIGSVTSGLGSVTSALGSVTSAIGSATSGMESSTATSDGGDASETSDGGNGGGSGGDSTGSDGDGSATSTDGDDAAPMVTAAPAGIIAAAGLAALML